MRNAIRTLLDWLDERFPPKVVVTEMAFRALGKDAIDNKNQLWELEKLHQSLEDRVSSLEKSITGIKDLLSKAGNPGIIEQKRRDEFIANGRMGS